MRKDDLYSKKSKPDGWKKEHYWKTVARISPDLVFSFDTIYRASKADQIAAQIIASFRKDDRMLQRDFQLVPIVHLPIHSSPKCNCTPMPDCAAQICSMVARELDPLMLAIPERELGDGLLERVKTVKCIRKALNAIGKYYPLHLLGTGNPVSLVALATAGADSFDGLEWCRTVADYESGYLFHFQQFDFFIQTHLHRIQDPRVRHLIENRDASYCAKVLGYNIDFFKDWMRTMQDMIHAGQIKTLLKTVPHIGLRIYQELSK